MLSLNLTTAKVDNPAEDTEVDAELEAYILEKIEERKAAKKEKDFAKRTRSGMIFWQEELC